MSNYFFDKNGNEVKLSDWVQVITTGEIAEIINLDDGETNCLKLKNIRSERIFKMALRDIKIVPQDKRVLLIFEK